MELALSSPRPRRVASRRPPVRELALRERCAAIVEAGARELLDPDRIEAGAEDLRLFERRREHHVGLVVCSLILSALQRSTDTEGRWLDAQRVYEDIGGAVTGATSFRNQGRKMLPMLRRLLRRRLASFAATTEQPELRGRLRDFADVLIPDGCAFKIAAALSNVYAGTSQPAELKLHAVYSVRAGGVISADRTAGSVHDSDGFWPERWERGALYLWDLGYVNNERFVDAALAGAHVLQRLKSGANPIAIASYGLTGERRELLGDEQQAIRLNDACDHGYVHRQRVLDLDVKIAHDERDVVARVVCMPFGGEDRYYLTTLPREIFTAHDVAELYRMRWEIELFFRGWKGAMRLEEVRRLQNEQSLEVMLTASLLAGTLAQQLTVAINELERLASEAISP
jgi:hypothetical protein